MPSQCVRIVTAVSTFVASMAGGEAVLRFPYDDRLRVLLRALPGRRWDAVERAWCIPLEPDNCEALARLFAGLPGTPQIGADLARVLARGRARRGRELVLALARPDGEWWLSFATDGPPELVGTLREHPHAYELPAIGRALVPMDDRAAWAVQALVAGGEPVRLSLQARRALEALHERGAAAGGEDPADPVARAVERLPEWRGTVEVAGPREAPVFVLLGDSSRLPAELRERARSAPGGVTVALTLEHWQLMEGRLRGWMAPSAARCVAALRAGRPAPPAVLELSRWHEEPTFVLAPGHEPAQLETFAQLAGALPGDAEGRARYEHARLPAIRADPFCVPQLDAFLADRGPWVAPEALERLQEIRELHARAAGLVALSQAREAELVVSRLGGELKPFQRAGVSYLLAQRRAFLADEQGLGKTIEALATLEADGAYPAVVVCPASLKLNWLREIERWLPGRSVRVLAGTGRPRAQTGGAAVVGRSAGDGPSERAPADVTVINYDIVAARLEELSVRPLRALVLDESHYCKNSSAQRTQAVQRLAGAVPDGGLVLALTGTPVMNRPAELVAQLRILGRLEEFGSGAQFGRRFRGPDAHVRLHWHLHARCFVRRLKQDVLPQLPPKTRSVVPVELDNAAEYRLAERDVVAWLQSQPLDLGELDAKVAAALRAERLVRLNALKLLAARGKLHAALAWIHNFCSSGEPLVVFAHHREIQRAVLERFPSALRILGEDSPAARERALRAFQEGEGAGSGLIVCSMAVAGQGLTLTRTSSVAFLELEWTPAMHDQAEDRCHRIGQRDAVNATYLLAADTIDETIATLLERKRAVIGAVTDGRSEEQGGVVDALVRELRGAPYRHLRAVA